MKSIHVVTSRKAEGSPVRGFAKSQKRSAGKCRRIPLEKLEPIIAGAISAIDEIIMQRLRGSLRGLSDAPVSALLERKLLPHKISSALIDAELISRWLVLARAAQEVTGIPSSILLAELWFGPHDPHGESAIPKNDLFKRGKSFASLGAALLDHASYLANERKFQRVMLAKDNPAKYLAAIGACELWKIHARQDRVDFIVGASLQECDALPVE
jgi:hypothetical protein